uniref:Uncharacterized protein n=1 Tax=Populus trichocarpa TaxID=3694 RepID=A9PB48_POPTR|nr:unknown [Populus trichocarpa]
MMLLRMKTMSMLSWNNLKMENYWTRFYQGIKGEGLLLLPLMLHIFLVAF